jgi:hypothetical protein
MIPDSFTVGIFRVKNMLYVANKMYFFAETR